MSFFYYQPPSACKKESQGSEHLKPRPLLRWAGSKRKLLNQLESAVPPKFGRYIEPFFGSGCLFFRIQPRVSIVNDLNQDLIAFYHVVREDPDKLLAFARGLVGTVESYYLVRSSFLQEQDRFRRAAKFFYLNRFCFNGIYRTNKKGQFNVPFGTKTGELPKLNAVEKSIGVLKGAELLSGDFELAASRARKGDFVYLDPPYVYKARKDRGEYGPGSFTIADLTRLTRCVDELHRKGAMFLLSYLECPEIEHVANQFKTTSVPVSRTISSIKSARSIVNEVLIKNY